MDLTEWALVFLAGLAAGTINTVVGSGTLITFPVLLGLGYPPVVANVSNSLGLVAGSTSGAWGYRREILSHLWVVRRVAPASAVGAVLGALLLLWLPARAFATIVPVLILLAVALVLAGPWIQRRSGTSQESLAEPRSLVSRRRWFLIVIGVGFAGVYGGYFGAAQGVIVLGVFAALVPISMQAANGIKNLLALGVNGLSAGMFVLIAPHLIEWTVVLVIAASSMLGGMIGARYGRRLPPAALRACVVVIGVVSVVAML